MPEHTPQDTPDATPAGTADATALGGAQDPDRRPGADDTDRRPAGDDTDRRLGGWAQLVPEIDVEVEAIVDRLLLAARYLEQLAAATAAPFGLHGPDYEILARLFWVGGDHALTPTQLAAGTLTRASTLTSRLDRLERDHLIRRVRDTRDRRSVRAQLTPAGAELFRRVIAEQAQREAAAFAGLTPAERAALADLLRRLMRTLTETLGPLPRRTALALAADGTGDHTAASPPTG